MMGRGRWWGRVIKRVGVGRVVGGVERGGRGVVRRVVMFVGGRREGGGVVRGWVVRKVREGVRGGVRGGAVVRRVVRRRRGGGGGGGVRGGGEGGRGGGARGAVAVALALEAQKVLLGVRADLDGGFGGDDSLDGFPFAAVLGEGGEEAGVLFFGPVLAAFGEDVFLAGGFFDLGGGGRGLGGGGGVGGGGGRGGHCGGGGVRRWGMDGEREGEGGGVGIWW